MILSFRFSGTSPSIILWANPSAMAVFPTPGSPTNNGLFFVRRVNICNTLRISSSRPITGSNFPFCANSLRFLAYLFKTLYVSSADAEVTRSPFRSSSMAAFSPFSVTPWSFRICATLLLEPKMANIKCSTETNSSFIFLAIISASFKVVLAVLESIISPPETFGKL